MVYAPPPEVKVGQGHMVLARENQDPADPAPHDQGVVTTATKNIGSGRRVIALEAQKTAPL